MTNHSPGLSVAVGVHIGVLLTERQLKPADLTRGLGKNANWVSRRMRGEVAMTMPDLEAVAAYLHVTPAEILRGASEWLDRRASYYKSAGPMFQPPLADLRTFAPVLFDRRMGASVIPFSDRRVSAHTEPRVAINDYSDEVCAA